MSQEKGLTKKRRKYKILHTKEETFTAAVKFNYLV